MLKNFWNVNLYLTRWITRNADGKICWLETSNPQGTAGFNHILERHMNDFSTFGINSESELLNFLNDTVYQIGDKYLNVVISSNGFIVTAHPITSLVDITKIIFN